MPVDGQSDLSSRTDDRFKGSRRQKGVHLNCVVALSFLALDFRSGTIACFEEERLGLTRPCCYKCRTCTRWRKVGGKRGLAFKDWAGGEDPRAECRADFNLLPERKDRRTPGHITQCCYPMGDQQQWKCFQRVCHRRPPMRQVTMHIRQSRH